MTDHFDVEPYIVEIHALVAAGCVHTGGPSRNRDLDLLDWAPPPWLQAIHTTFGGVGWRVGKAWMPGSLLPWSACVPLTRRIRFGEENILFDPADTVLISPDDRGGGLVLCGRDAPCLRFFAGPTHTLGDELPPAQALRQLIDAWSAALTAR